MDWRNKVRSRHGCVHLQHVADHLFGLAASYTAAKDYSLRQCWTLFLLCSFLYYHCDESLLTDSQYDAISRRLKSRYYQLLDDGSYWSQDCLRSCKPDWQAAILHGFQVRVQDYPPLITQVAKVIVERLRCERGSKR